MTDDASLERQKAKAQTGKRTIEIVGIVIAVVTLAVTVYFSVRSERTKQLTVRFGVKRSLVSIGERRASSLAISFRGAPIAQPWLMSIRVENSGSVPIEGRDIERPIRLQFSSARVVIAEVVGTSPQDLTAAVQPESSAVTLSHGLLNPGDAIDLDVLTAGAPDYPRVVTRISGIAAANIVLPTDSIRPRRATGITLPRFAEMLLLLVFSLLLAGLVIAGISLGGETIRKAFAKWVMPQAIQDLRTEGLFIPFDDETSVPQWIREEVRILRAPDVENRQELQNYLGATVPAEQLKHLGLSLEAATEQVLAVAKARVPAAVARQFYYGLPGGLDTAVQTHISRFPYTVGSINDYIDDARRELEQFCIARRGLRSINTGEILGALMLIGFGGIGGLIVLESWRFLAP